MKNVISFSLAVALICGSAALAESIGVLEAAGLGESARSELYDNLTQAGFAYQRPLAGRLEGQGSVWSIPEGMPMVDAAAIAGSMDGVVGTEDLSVCAEPSECSPVSYALPGQLKTAYAFALGTPEVDAVRDALRAKGFRLLLEKQSGVNPTAMVWDLWEFFPREYTLENAEDALAGTHGVANVMVIGRAREAMCAGVQYAGVLHDEGLDDDGRIRLHSRLRDLGLQYARPLVGRYEGCGDAWIVPRGAKLHLVAAVPDVTEVVNLHSPLPWEGTGVLVLGEWLLTYNSSGKWQTRRDLQDKGFMLKGQIADWYADSEFESWIYLKREYTISGSSQAIRTTQGMTGWEPNYIYYYYDFYDGIGVKDLIAVRNCLGRSVCDKGCGDADFNGDWRIDVLDLIALRNYMQRPLLNE